MKTLTVVIIEDEDAHFSLMKRAIDREFSSASVVHFQDASTCLDHLDRINPTVIITDYLMPGMNGLEFLEVLNQHLILMLRLLKFWKVQRMKWIQFHC